MIKKINNIKCQKQLSDQQATDILSTTHTNESCFQTYTVQEHTLYPRRTTHKEAHRVIMTRFLFHEAAITFACDTTICK